MCNYKSFYIEDLKGQKLFKNISTISESHTKDLLSIQIDNHETVTVGIASN